MDALVDDKDSKNTKLAVKQTVKILRDFLANSGSPVEFEGLSEEDLNKQLCRFWPKAKQKNGQYYKKKTLEKLKISK